MALPLSGASRLGLRKVKAVFWDRTQNDLMLRITILAGLTLTSLSGCATPAPHQAPVEQAINQPFSDLRLVQEDTPEILKAAVAAPYASPQDCTALADEIDALNEALGPDLDVRSEDSGQTGAQLLASAIGGVFSLPFRGIVRQLTGAQQRDREKAQAIVAGVGRRGFLRALEQERAC
jgi:hypothetical protein